MNLFKNQCLNKKNHRMKSIGSVTKIQGQLTLGILVTQNFSH